MVSRKRFAVARIGSGALKVVKEYRDKIRQEDEERAQYILDYVRRRQENEWPKIQAVIDRLLANNPGWAAEVETIKNDQTWLRWNVLFWYLTPHPTQGYHLGVEVNGIDAVTVNDKDRVGGYTSSVLIRKDGERIYLMGHRRVNLAEAAEVWQQFAAWTFVAVNAAFGNPSQKFNLHSRSKPGLLSSKPDGATRLELLGMACESQAEDDGILLVDAVTGLPNLPLWPWWDTEKENQPRIGAPDFALDHFLVSPTSADLVKWMTGHPIPTTLAKQTEGDQLTFGLLGLEAVQTPEEVVDEFLDEWRTQVLRTGSHEISQELLTRMELRDQVFWGLKRSGKLRNYLIQIEHMRRWPKLTGRLDQLTAEEIAKLPAVVGWSRYDAARTAVLGDPNDYMADVARYHLNKALGLRRGVRQIWINWHVPYKAKPQDLALALGKRIVEYYRWESIKASQNQPAFADLKPGDRVATYWSGELGTGTVAGPPQVNPRYTGLIVPITWDNRFAFSLHESGWLERSCLLAAAVDQEEQSA